jgi:hypothetical protein
LLFSGLAFAQGDINFRMGQQKGWDPRASQGRCEVRLWVDHLAELRIRGDNVSVHTVEGARSYDEGSACNSPLPYTSMVDFQLRQTAGRNRVTLVQQPDRMNNYSAVLSINDNQGGGDHYAFELTWRLEGNRPPTAPAPFFDDIRACQDMLRQTFLSRNGRGAYIDFDGSANRRDQNRGNGRSQGQEFIRGRGVATKWNESRDISYSCVVDPRSLRVLSGDYQYVNGSQGNQRDRLR